LLKIVDTPVNGRPSLFGLKVAPITEKFKENHLNWYGQVMRREKNHVARRVMNMNVEGLRGRGHLKQDGLAV
jgi:hypothetical protein